MATIDILRRRIAMAQAKADEYEGVELGWYDRNGTRSHKVLATSPLIDVSSATSQGHILEWNAKNDLGFMQFLGADMSVKWSVQTRTSAMSGVRAADDVYFCMTLAVETMDDAYILDRTTGEYLWAGKNVK